MYSSERIKIQPGGYRKIDMKLSIRLPQQIVTCCTLLLTFSENGLKLENCQYISTDNNIINFNQPIILPWKLQLDLVNRSMNTTFLISKKQELAFIVPLNEGLEQLNVKYTKT